MISSQEKDISAIFPINHAVEIEVHNADGVDRYRSSVSDVEGSIIALAMPMRGTSYVPLPGGSEVLVSIVQFDALYAVKAKVIANIFEPIPVMLVNVETSLQRLQRRRHVRIDTCLPSARIIVKAGPPEEWETIKVTIASLSAGGIGFKSIGRIAPGSEVLAEFSLDDGQSEEISLNAKVVRYEEDVRRKPAVFYVGCFFTSLPTAIEKRLTTYIFRKQIELRRKGLV
jgi:c-di-GMP-binding flagellar brake protein YcgR